jgi:hypothetical protein
MGSPSPPSESWSIRPVERCRPPPATASDGRANVSTLLWELLARPSQLASMMRIAADSYMARAALVRLRRVLGPDFRCR